MAERSSPPRRARGITPQARGFYPAFDVLDQAQHWDEATRRVVLARVHDVPPIRFFTPQEAATLRAFLDTLLAQDEEPRIAVLNFVDEKLHAGRREGYRHAGMPDDDDVWRLVAQGLDQEARERGTSTFAEAAPRERRDIVDAFQDGVVSGGAWDRLIVKRAWGVVARDAVSAFYAHPWAWNEIGFAGPAYPRGYTRLGLGMREAWEADEVPE